MSALTLELKSYNELCADIESGVVDTPVVVEKLRELVKDLREDALSYDVGVDFSSLMPSTGKIKAPTYFSMCTLYAEHGCGTVACIGGLLAIRLGYDPYSGPGLTRLKALDLDCLFYVKNRHSEDNVSLWPFVTPTIAADTIEGMLKSYETTGYGEVHWDLVELRKLYKNSSAE